MDSTPYREAAGQYWKNGWTNVLPLVGKFPPPTGYTGAGGRIVSFADMQTWLDDPNTPPNIAIRLQSGVVGIDVDDYDDKDGAASFDRAVETLGTLPPTFTSTSRGPEQPSRIYLLKVPVGTDLKAAQKRFREAFGPDVDIIHAGHRYVMAAPSIHPKTGAMYSWYDFDGDPMFDYPDLQNVPDLPEPWLDMFTAPEPEPTHAVSSAFDDDGDRAFTPEEAEQRFINPALARVREAKNGSIHDTLYRSALMISHFVPTFITPEEATARLKSALESTVADEPARASEQIRNGLKGPTDAKERWSAVLRSVEPVSVTEDTSVGDFFTDAQLSRAFKQQRLAGRYLWSAGLGWLKWTGKKWADVSDESMLQVATEWVITRTRAVVGRPPHPSGKTMVEMWKPYLKLERLKALVTLGKGLVEVDAGVFDQNPDILNTPSGIVDLRTGDLRPNDPKALCRKITKVAYDPTAKHEDWTDALKAVPEDSLEWFHLFMGQSITGHPNSDDRILILQGGGSNGKTAVVTGGICRAIGDYYTMLSDQVLLADTAKGATPEIMALQGIRLAVMEETQDGHKLNTQRLKKIVGVGRLKGRHLYKNDTEFDETHTVVINTNYLPVVRETDTGTWRRLMTLPFPYTYRATKAEVVGPDDRLGDLALKGRLATDPEVGEAILKWLIDGAVSWYARGAAPMEPTDRIRKATAAWRIKNDLVLGFFQSGAVERAEGCHVMSTDLLSAFNAWLATQGNPPWTDRTLAERINGNDYLKATGGQKNIVKVRIKAGSLYHGELSRQPYVNATPPRGQYMGWINMRFVDPSHPTYIPLEEEES